MKEPNLTIESFKILPSILVDLETKSEIWGNFENSKNLTTCQCMECLESCILRVNFSSKDAFIIKQKVMKISEWTPKIEKEGKKSILR